MAKQLSVGARSERGMRSSNQDRITRFRCRFGEVFVVADGMGGAKSGDVAAGLVADTLNAKLSAVDGSASPGQALAAALEAVNRDVNTQSHANAEMSGMGSTAVVALLASPEPGRWTAQIVHVGDSRAYLHRRNSLVPITRDHSIYQERIQQGVEPAVAAQQPDASHLTRAIGTATEVQPEVSEVVPLESGDRLILCTDGLTGYVADNVIAEILSRQPAATQAVDALIRAAMQHGSDDNISVQVIDLPASSPAALPRNETNPRTLNPLLAAIAGALLVTAAVFAFRHFNQPPMPAAPKQEQPAAAAPPATPIEPPAPASKPPQAQKQAPARRVPAAAPAEKRSSEPNIKESEYDPESKPATKPEAGSQAHGTLGLICRDGCDKPLETKVRDAMRRRAGDGNLRELDELPTQGFLHDILGKRASGSGPYFIVSFARTDQDRQLVSQLESDLAGFGGSATKDGMVNTALEQPLRALCRDCKAVVVFTRNE